MGLYRVENWILNNILVLNDKLLKFGNCEVGGVFYYR